MLLQVDFAMVNSCEYKNEIQLAVDGKIYKRFDSCYIQCRTKGFMLDVVDELTFKDKRDFTVYSDGPSKEF